MNKLFQIIFFASATFAIFGQVCQSAEILRQASGPEVDLAPVDSGEETTETPDDDGNVDLARADDDRENAESRGWLCESYYRNVCSNICVSENSKVIRIFYALSLALHHI